MLPKARRIRSSRDHRDLWKFGRSVRGKYMVMRVRPAQEKDNRFGFVVSSAIAKKAILRNTIKRKLRAAASGAPPTTSDAVFYATKAATTATYQELKNELVRLLTQTHATPPRRPY